MVFQWAKDWVMDKVYGAASTAIQAGGTMAGNTVGGVGTMIENSGRGVGSSASGIAGYVGGVGSYINSYGDSIINSTAASGGGSAEKKTAVKPTQAVSKTAGGAQKAATGAAKSLPSVPAAKALPAAQRKTSPAQRGPPGKPPAKVAPAKAPPAKKPGTPSQISTSKPTNNLTRITATAADKTPDGKTRISAASRPQRSGAGAGNHTASAGVKKTTQNNSGPRPLTKIAAGKEDRTPDGKIKISAASRPRPVKAA